MPHAIACLSVMVERREGFEQSCLRLALLKVAILALSSLKQPPGCLIRPYSVGHVGLQLGRLPQTSSIVGP